MQRKKMAGKGIGGDHSSVIPLAYDLMKYCEKLSTVDRMSPGYIALRKTKVRSLKVARESGSLLVRVVERGMVQDLRIYGSVTNDLQLVEDSIEDWCQKEKITYRFIDKR